MGIRQLYDPEKVYTGWFECWFIRPWIVRYADFRDGGSTRGTLLSLSAWMIVTIGLVGVLMGAVGLLGPEVGFTSLKAFAWIWGLASVVPFCALLARALSGKKEEEPNPKLLPLDISLMAASGLFFIFGLLMMETTIHSEILSADPGTPEEETVAQDSTFVSEEPIFTYQDNTTADTVAADTMSDLSEPDLVAPDESFDPTIATDPDASSPAPSDTIYF